MMSGWLAWRNDLAGRTIVGADAVGDRDASGRAQGALLGVA